MAIGDVLRSIDLTGRTTRDGAEEALAILERDHPDDLRAHMRQLAISDFASSLRSIQHGRRVSDRNAARARSLADREYPRPLDLLVRLYAVEDGRRVPLGELTPDDRRYILDQMAIDIETRRREMEFLAELDARAGDQTVSEALDEATVSDLYVKIVGEVAGEDVAEQDEEPEGS